ncbi:MAG: hypothetical protein EBV06_17810 [Planctomycetia bacterium]|nr:hypothetical protein [Planctomycetia bacterium]
MLTGSYDNTAKVWDALKGQEVLSLKGHTDLVTSVAWSPDGKVLFAWDQADKVLAWSLETGQPVAANNPPKKPADRSAISPDGRFSATANKNIVELIPRDKPLAGSFPWPLPQRDERLRYHSELARTAEKDGHFFSAAFHVGRMLRDDPDNAELKKRLEALRDKPRPQPDVQPAHMEHVP